MKRLRLGLVAFVLFVAGLLTFSDKNHEEINRSPSADTRSVTIYNRTIPLHNLEVVPQGESESILSLEKTVTEYFAKEYAKPSQDSGSGIPIQGTRRGVHPKAHGCAVGTMTVNESLDPIDRVGIFQPSANYPITIRFSNAGPRQHNQDKEADSRGFAFKVHNVKGKPVLETNEELTQDFTMNSTDQFFTESGPSYARFMRIALVESKDSGEAARNYIVDEFKNGNYALARRAAVAFAKMSFQKPSNPLALEYFSISPFQHGAGPDAPIVKHRLLPCEGTWKEERDENEPHFLRKALHKHLNAKSACFDFFVQHRTKKSLPVENPSIPWKESVAPFKKVARIEIPKQVLMDEVACEKLVINPWNSIEEHKPVGGINRIRLGSYLFSVDRRRATNRY